MREIRQKKTVGTWGRAKERRRWGDGLGRGRLSDPSPSLSPCHPDFVLFVRTHRMGCLACELEILSSWWKQRGIIFFFFFFSIFFNSSIIHLSPLKSPNDFPPSPSFSLSPPLQYFQFYNFIARVLFLPIYWPIWFLPLFFFCCN